MNTFCSNCGYKLSDSDEAFCPECGTKVEAAAAPPAPAQTEVSLPLSPAAPTVQAVPKNIILLIAGAAVLIAVLVLIITRFGGGQLTGTWQEAGGDGAWVVRTTINRNNTGTSFEFNTNTAMTRAEISFVWQTVDVGDTSLLIMEIVSPDDPAETFLAIVEFEIIENALGNEVLRMRDYGGWGSWESFRRVN